MKREFELIQQWISPKSRVLDLGCGNGELLAYLQAEKKVSGYGIEINKERITQCIKKGVNVVEQNLNHGLDNFQEQSFDVVVMSQALQAVQRPDQLLLEMLRIGQKCVVTFPNFGHWSTRTYLLFKGRMPVSRALPYHWYNTPNIHLCTFKDFEALCRRLEIQVLSRTVVDSRHQDRWAIRLFPNLLGEIALYHVTKKESLHPPLSSTLPLSVPDNQNTK